MRSDEDFVFYNQPRHPSGKVWRLGKKRVAEGLTDTIQTELTGVESGVSRILLVASADGVPFDRVQALRILLYDAAGTEAEALAYFDVKPETGEETALICGELYRRGEGWKFRALGEGYSNGLQGLATDYGISVDESEAAQETTGLPTTAGTTQQPTATVQPSPRCPGRCLRSSRPWSPHSPRTAIHPSSPRASPRTATPRPRPRRASRGRRPATATRRRSPRPPTLTSACPRRARSSSDAEQARTENRTRTRTRTRQGPQRSTFVL